MAVDARWQRLGEMLLNRRVELTGDTNREAFARDAGLRYSRSLFDIENGKRDNYSPAMLAQMEQVYRWAAGSIELVLQGGQPIELSDGHRSAALLSLKDRRYTGQTELVCEWVARWYLNVPVENRDHAVDLLIQFTEAHPIAGDEGD